MIKILFVSIIIMLYEYGLKKSVSTLQKRNYAPKKIKTLSGFGGCRLQHPPKPPTVFGARCVSRRPMKSETYFKTSRTIFAKIQLYSLYSPFVGENSISQILLSPKQKKGESPGGEYVKTS